MTVNDTQCFYLRSAESTPCSVYLHTQELYVPRKQRLKTQNQDDLAPLAEFISVTLCFGQVIDFTLFHFLLVYTKVPPELRQHFNGQFARPNGNWSFVVLKDPSLKKAGVLLP